MASAHFGKLILKPGREKSLLQRHPWIFSGAIERVDGDPSLGETVAILGADRKFLAWAAYSPISQIRARVWSFHEPDRIDEVFLAERLKLAFTRRDPITADPGTNAYRLVYAESDGIPGLVVDRYADHLVVQCLSAGAERWKPEITGLLADLTGAKSITERSDVDVRSLEGLPQVTGLLAGSEPPEQIEIQENGLRFWVDVRTGHKTGFYLDQRPNRQRLREWAAGREILNCFSYTGGFSVYGLAGRAGGVISVDSSQAALGLCAANLSLNGFQEGFFENIEGDVFHVLRSFRDQARSFDLILLDPPKFAHTASQVEKAARGYKDINLLALKLLRPGGILFTFSCSGAVSAELFQKIVAGAAQDAGIDAHILEYLHQGPDHPTLLNFPEGAYLKGLVVRKGN